MENELQLLRRQFQLIQSTVTSKTYNLGNEFYKEIVLALNDALSADYTFVGEFFPEAHEVRSIALVSENKILPNFSYNLAKTPCENVVGNSVCSYPGNVAELFPEDELLIQMGIDAYIGVPLFDSMKNPTGILVSLFKKPIQDYKLYESILLLFAWRAGAELEHQKLYNELNMHKNKLEVVVEERTKHLKKALEDLTKAQVNLIKSEKQASLVTLTSGMAHQINNPLNFIMAGYSGMKKYLETIENVDKEIINKYFVSIKTGVEKIADISNVLSQYTDTTNEFKHCNLHSILNNAIYLLDFKINKNIIIENKFNAEKHVLMAHFGQLIQLFVIIMANALKAINKNGTIKIETYNKDNNIIISIKDNGCGIHSNNMLKLTDPFFTTRDEGEGVGLGLFHANNIVKEHKGKLEFRSVLGEYTEVIISFPL